MKLLCVMFFFMSSCKSEPVPVPAVTCETLQQDLLDIGKLGLPKPERRKAIRDKKAELKAMGCKK